MQHMLTTDPYHGNWQQPYGHHPYQYAYSNPLRFADPSGEIVIVPFLAILAVSAIAYGVGSYGYVEAQKHDNQWAATGLDLVFGYGATQEAVRAWQNPNCSSGGERAWKTFWGALSMVGGMTAGMPIAGAVGGMLRVGKVPLFAAKASAIDTGVGTITDVMRAIENGGNGLAEMRRLTGDPTLELIQGGLGNGVLGYFNAQENAIYYAGTHPDPALIAHELTHKLQSMRGGAWGIARRVATVMPSSDFGPWRTPRGLVNRGRAGIGTFITPHVYLLNPVELEANVNALYYAFGWNRITWINFVNPASGHFFLRLQTEYATDPEWLHQNAANTRTNVTNRINDLMQPE